MKLGQELDFVFQVQTPLEKRAPYTYKVVAGSYLAIASIGQNVATSRLQAVKSQLKNTQQILQSKDQTQIAALTREDILGNMFEAGVLGYFAEYNALGHIMAEQQRAGQSLAIGYGSYGYEPNVTVLFGIPTAITPGGAVMNIRIGNYVTTHTNDHQANIQFNEQLGALSSELEASIPEQMFSTPDHRVEGISAVKALAIANREGQRIYTITSNNRDEAMSHLHLSSQVENEIREAVNAGRVVTTHTDPVTVPGYQGAGYVIQDPNTGVAAWKIGGSLNGGEVNPQGLLQTTLFILDTIKNIAIAVADKTYLKMADAIVSIANAFVTLFTSCGPFLATVFVIQWLALFTVGTAVLGLISLEAGLAAILYAGILGAVISQILGSILNAQTKLCE